MRERGVRGGRGERTQEGSHLVPDEGEDKEEEAQEHGDVEHRPGRLHEGLDQHPHAAHLADAAEGTEDPHGAEDGEVPR